MDCVYIYKSFRDGGRELRHSLRSLKNIEHGDVYVVGDSETWFSDKIIHISAPLIRSPYPDVVNKLKIACQDERISDDFYFFNDDFLITEPTEITQMYRATPATFDTYHKRCLKKTFDLLNNMGVDKPLDYELHAPMIINKEKWLETYEIIKKDMYPVPLLHRSVYGNLNNIGGIYYADQKSYQGEKPNGTFISTSRYFDWVDRMFPEPSIYETN